MLMLMVMVILMLCVCYVVFVVPVTGKIHGGDGNDLEGRQDRRRC